MPLLRKDLSNVTDIGFIYFFLCSYLIQLLLCFAQMYGKTQKSSEVRAGTKLLIGGVSVQSQEDKIRKYP